LPADPRRTANTWAAWFAFLAALFALPMTAVQVELYRLHRSRRCKGRDNAGEFMLVHKASSTVLLEFIDRDGLR
jgi:hypothetical protein